MREIAERRRMQRERDQKNEDDLEKFTIHFEFK